MGTTPVISRHMPCACSDPLRFGTFLFDSVYTVPVHYLYVLIAIRLCPKWQTILDRIAAVPKFASFSVYSKASNDELRCIRVTLG